MDNTNYRMRLNNVSKRIGKREVLSNISMSLGKGRIYGVVGINGSGKTMLFRAIAGLIQPSSGSIVRYDEDIRIGVIIENPGFLQTYTGFDNLKFLARICRVIDDERIRNCMTTVGLNPEDKRLVKEYSLGMKQKLAIVQAIMERPNVLILDEPMRGLDQESVIKIRDILCDFREQGCTVLISSHNADDISSICDEVYEMREGHLFYLEKT